MADTIERIGIVKMMGMPITLLGPQLNAGESAPELEVITPDLEEINPLAQNDNVIMLFSGPSVDAEVCHSMTQHIDGEALTLPENVDIYMTTVDLPFSLKRWHQSYTPKRVKLLSDYRLHSLGLNYGLLIKEFSILARAAIVIDRKRHICHFDLVAEVSEQPDYSRAFAAAKTAAQTRE